MTGLVRLTLVTGNNGNRGKHGWSSYLESGIVLSTLISSKPHNDCLMLEQLKNPILQEKMRILPYVTCMGSVQVLHHFI